MGRPRNDVGYDPQEKVTVVFPHSETERGFVPGSLNGARDHRYPHGYPRGVEITMTKAQLSVFDNAKRKSYKQIPAQGKNGEMEMQNRIIETKRYPYEVVR